MKIQPFTKKDLFRVRRWNQVVGAVNSLLNILIKRGEHDGVFYGDREVILQVKRTAEAATTSGSGTLSRYYFVSMEANHIVCNTGEGTASVNIAKPPLLREEASRVIGTHTVTYSSYVWASQIRDASTDIGSGTETITPPYNVGDAIFAMSANHTGVTVGSVELALIDINVDGRAWALRV